MVSKVQNKLCLIEQSGALVQYRDIQIQWRAINLARHFHANQDAVYSAKHLTISVVISGFALLQGTRYFIPSFIWYQCLYSFLKR